MDTLALDHYALQPMIYTYLSALCACCRFPNMKLLMTTRARKRTATTAASTMVRVSALSTSTPTRAATISLSPTSSISLYPSVVVLVAAWRVRLAVVEEAGVVLAAAPPLVVVVVTGVVLVVLAVDKTD
jgi:hypothetical protein